MVSMATLLMVPQRIARSVHVPVVQLKLTSLQGLAVLPLTISQLVTAMKVMKVGAVMCVQMVTTGSRG